MTTGRINQITILSLLQLLSLKEGSSQKISQVLLGSIVVNESDSSLESYISKLERIQSCFCSFPLLLEHQLDRIYLK